MSEPLRIQLRDQARIPNASKEGSGCGRYAKEIEDDKKVYASCLHGRSYSNHSDEGLVNAASRSQQRGQLAMHNDGSVSSTR